MIQHTGEGHHVILVQVDILPVDAYTQGDDVHGIDDLDFLLCPFPFYFQHR